jgi:hypothetical protein
MLEFALRLRYRRDAFLNRSAYPNGEFSRMTTSGASIFISYGFMVA